VDRIIKIAADFLQLAIDYLDETAIWTQFIVIAVLFVAAVLLAHRVEPILEEQARKIKGMPGLLRVIVALLRRFKWLFFVIFLTIAYAGTSVSGWPGSNYLIYAAALLSGSWLLISVVSLVIRSRVLGRLFALVAWIYVATLILGIVDDVASFLDAAGFNFGSVRLSLLTALQTAFLLGIALWLSLNIGNFFDRRIQHIDELTPSLRVLLGKITRISLVILAGLLVISGLGIDLTALTVLSGAVGVGIGFGLQKVVSNFISGIIILLDQSIKPGDTISLGETFGWIRELRARFVSVITRDGREFLIPNEDFITREVINWSFSDRYVRLDVDFGVSYDSDPHEVIAVAIAASGAVDRVDSRYKPPVCWMTAFGNSSLDFRLRFWIDDPQQGLTNVRGKVLLALWDAFKEHNIDIPYPHREVIFKTPIQVQST
jgi:small-conductance mechanosensitive channel